MKTFKGTNASPGWSSSKAFLLNNEINFNNTAKLNIMRGLEILTNKYESLISELKSSNRELEAEIILGYKLILNDPEILTEIEDLETKDIKTIHSIFLNAAEQMNLLENEYFKQRSEDILSVGKELILTMQEAHQDKVKDEEVIIIAKDLTPTDTSSLNLKNVKGFIVEKAGPTSHTVIIAKNLGIPCVIGLKLENFEGHNDSMIVIDGSSGNVYVEPTNEILDQVRNYQLLNLDVASNYTQDNIIKLGIEFRANIGSEEELEIFNDKIINSVGLFRSEFIYINSDRPPTLEEQIGINNKIDSKFSGAVVFRTLDIGGDKQVPYLNLPEEENPFLGVRGIRLSLVDEKIFREQIVSILSSKLLPKVKIMFPMVALLEDFLKAKDIVVKEAQNLGVEVPKLGVMIETPAAAIGAESFIGHVDFFSIGTNDLVQYTLAADRGLSSLADYQDSLHPSVLYLINKVIEVGKLHNIEVSVCGDMASDIEGAKILYGLGLRIFSLAPSQAPLILDSILKFIDSGRKLDKNEILVQKNSQNVRKLIE